MRCRECNVDLPETYTACPLCGGKATPDAPVIEGIRTAEYPKVKTEPYKKNPFNIFIIVWLAAGVLSAILFSTSIAAAVICAVPCIWTLVFRPLCVKQLYAGNYIVMNLFPFALASVVFSKLQYESLQPAFTVYLPVCCIAVLVALTVLILAKPKSAKRAAAYPVLFAVLSVAVGIVTAVKTAAVPFLWLGVIVLCVCILALLFFMNPKAAKEELKAKFSIQ